MENQKDGKSQEGQQNTKDNQQAPFIDAEQEKDEEDVDLDDFLGPTAPLNLTADEKDERDDLDDAAIEKEYEDFMKSLNMNDQTKNILDQLGMMFKDDGNFNANFGSNANFGQGNLYDENKLEDLTSAIMGGFLKKEVIYEPLLEVREKLKGISSPNSENQAKLTAKIAKVSEIIEIYEKPDHDSKENREKVEVLFEEFKDLGGLPDEIVDDNIRSSPMFKMTENQSECSIF